MDMLKLPQQFLHMNGIGDRAEGHNAISFRIIFLILFTLTLKQLHETRESLKSL